MYRRFKKIALSLSLFLSFLLTFALSLALALFISLVSLSWSNIQNGFTRSPSIKRERNLD